MSKLIKSNLFSLPIYQIKIDPNLYDKEKILSDIEYNKSLQNSRNATHQKIGRYNSDIHHSYKDFDNEDFRIRRDSPLYKGTLRNLNFGAIQNEDFEFVSVS